MRIAKNWTDYEVIDCSAGEKLERWGKYILLRPDPQVIWDTPKKNGAWRKLNAHYHRSAKGGGSWEFFDLPEEWRISYALPEIRTAELSVSSDGAKAPVSKTIGGQKAALTFGLKPFAFKHTGVFPEQAANWDVMYTLIKEETASRRAVGNNEPVKVLNLFAYTGGATLACAAAGASVAHVDASKGMVTWAKENASLSGLDGAPIRWLVDDCKKFVERELRRGNRYDAVIMDPPSYGRGPKGEIWKIEDAVFELIDLCTQLLYDRPLFFLVNSYTTGLQPGVLHYMISSALKKQRPAALENGAVEADEIGLPVTDSGLVLPCGASGWYRCSR